MPQAEELTQKNIEGIIIDTRNTNKFTGDFEWIRNTKNGYIGYGSAIHSPMMANGETKIYRGSSTLTKVEKLINDVQENRNIEIVGRSSQTNKDGEKEALQIIEDYKN